MNAIITADHIVNFPREFERKTWDDLDKRYYMILILSWLTVYTLVTIMGNIQYNTNAHVAKARADYLDLIRQAIPAEILDPVDSTPALVEEIPGNYDPETSAVPSKAQETSPVAEGQGASAVEKIHERRAQQAVRLAARQRMVKEAGQAGVIGLLNSGSNAGSGRAVQELLKNSGTAAGNLEDVIADVTGLATAAETGGRTARVGPGRDRVIGSADVSVLLSDVGATGSTSIGRKGSIALTLGSARIQGRAQNAAQRSYSEISKVINMHNAAIEYCFKREAKLNPNQKGEMLIELVITHSGHVKTVRVIKSSFPNSGIDNCVTSRIRSWRFKPVSPQQGEVTVRQKYIFN